MAVGKRATFQDLLDETVVLTHGGKINLGQRWGDTLVQMLEKTLTRAARLQ